MSLTKVLRTAKKCFCSTCLKLFNLCQCSLFYISKSSKHTTGWIKKLVKHLWRSLFKEIATPFSSYLFSQIDSIVHVRLGSNNASVLQVTYFKNFEIFEVNFSHITCYMFTSGIVSVFLGLNFRFLFAKNLFEIYCKYSR